MQLIFPSVQLVRYQAFRKFLLLSFSPSSQTRTMMVQVWYKRKPWQIIALVSWQWNTLRWWTISTILCSCGPLRYHQDERQFHCWAQEAANGWRPRRDCVLHGAFSRSRFRPHNQCCFFRLFLCMLGGLFVSCNLFNVLIIIKCLIEA